MPATGPLSVAELSASICYQIEAMPEFQAARTVLSYTPMKGEVDVSSLDCSGKEVILADCPWEEIPASRIEFAIVPGVAFAPMAAAPRGFMRLGRGGGYYDRLLPLLHCKTVAPAFPFQIYDTVPADPWDCPVQEVVTPLSLIEKLALTHRLTAEEYKALLQDEDARTLELLQQKARETAVRVFGKGVFVRGLIEISNYCRNNCLYCGIRAGNTSARRYRLTKEEILECCRKGHALGFRTFVLQGGEDPVQTDSWVEDVVRAVHKEFPDCAITLSLGEKTKEAYRKFKQAGAERYLLRHETFNAEHYSRLHPAGMSGENRLKCLEALKENGYQTGTGIMVGSPYQTIDNIVEDILFIQDLKPEMIGLGPFIHHDQTPFGGFKDGSVELTLKLIAIFRLVSPHALIPSTTSLATLDPDGRKKGILSGANVVMPNLSPQTVRADYDLYEGKASRGAESAEGLEELESELNSIGYSIDFSRGDYNQSF